jgi:2-oxopent-4-enoate/cis-2-oxohex-4-enoate hydratase
MDAQTIFQYGDDLYGALRERRTLTPLTDRDPAITIEDAYQISLRFLERRLGDGEYVIGKKIGVTNKVVMDMLNVRQPDFGFLTDRMLVEAGAPVPASQDLIQPRAEAEIAFRLSSPLKGPGIDEAAVLAATGSVHPCFEIVDSRINGWRIKIQDTVADNASCGMLVIGEDGADPREADLVTCGAVVWKNGELLSTGAGAAALGSPLTAIAWLANTLGGFGIALNAGDIVLSGSLVPLEPVKAGDRMRTRIGGLGELEVEFS